MSNKQMFTTSKDDKECGELKNIQYQTMLLNGAPENVCGNEDMVTNFKDFIDNQQRLELCKPWSKLDKIVKLDRLDAYVETLNEKLEPSTQGERLSQEKQKELKTFLRNSLHRKKLQRVKDVVYDKTKGCIINIPGLTMNKKRNFTLSKDKKMDSSLKNLAPKLAKTMKKAPSKKVSQKVKVDET